MIFFHVGKDRGTKSPFDEVPHIRVGKTQGKEIAWVVKFPQTRLNRSRRESKNNTDHTVKNTARERWAKRREETLCASFTQLQKKSEEPNVVRENCGSE